ncbi:DUF456 domain-containing protein [Kurthia huakuii]|uniref:DUF456 domain-containing protein n=1 Tax=Kurthia huakuii TaxID=1421019 RepID=UPI000497AB04|nr:DUF456 domain-containing protein [Kurthia huakuii]MBM7698009.1 uncharacterized protein YqgC (DUF456 family) [Kurthia huakuii]
MTILAWTIIILLFITAFVGLIYPIIPAVVCIFAGFIVYGLFFSFGDLPWWFWLIEILLTVLIFGADAISNWIGVKKFGGTNAGVWGSTIGLLIGPFVIPFAGILIGPFVGAVIAEWIVSRKNFVTSCKIGFGSLIGFLTSVVTKGIIQVVMIVIFVIAV